MQGQMKQPIPDTATLLRTLAQDERYSESVRAEAERRACQIDEDERLVSLLSSADICFA